MNVHPLRGGSGRGWRSILEGFHGADSPDVARICFLSPGEQWGLLRFSVLLSKAWNCLDLLKLLGIAGICSGLLGAGRNCWDLPRFA